MKKRKLTIKPWLGLLKEPAYDLVAVALGFEARAVHLAENLEPLDAIKVAWAFDDATDVLSYQHNREVLERLCYEIVGADEGIPRLWIAQAVRREANDGPVRICVDVSSLTRRRVALWVNALQEYEGDESLMVDFVYSAARYAPPPRIRTANRWAGPVIPAFAGWSTDPSLPTAMLLGLGYEKDRAIGAVEYIEPAKIIAFEPVSDEPRFTEKILEANDQLWMLRPKPSRMRYRVEEPFETFLLIEGVIDRLSRTHRPVLLPFGPKIFTLVATLCGAFHANVSVWRVSAGSAEEPIQREPSGALHGLTVLFER